MDSYLPQTPLEEVDPAIHELINRETLRQDETIILVASASRTPTAVMQALTSSFGNIVAEGYPREASRKQTEPEILDYEKELALYRRNSDPRYYKGVEFASLLEALTRRRAAELFAANDILATNLFVNVQPLSGSPANSAVYTALLNPGDTILGLSLNDGGHLSHGTRINRSGKHYKGVSYFVDPETEKIDYDAVEQIALETGPQLIVAGFSAYPHTVDWHRFRQIADKTGAYLLADIAHIAGLVASGHHPSPIGIADVVTTTTHKSLCGSFGALIMTHRKDLSSKIDQAVFPGEQGEPHLNSMAAAAVALKLANSDVFRQLQRRVVDNAKRLASKLEAHGLRLVGGGTENHQVIIDTKSISHDGVPLSGDMAARILDRAGIVLNRNTIPGDRSALEPTGVRIGTVWISQLGFGEAEVDQLADAISTVLHGCKPFTYLGFGNKPQLRAKVSFAALQKARRIVRDLRKIETGTLANTSVSIRGVKSTPFLDAALVCDVLALPVGESRITAFFIDGERHEGVLHLANPNEYILQFEDAETAEKTAIWLSDLSDGYVLFSDLHAKLPGPVIIKPTHPPLNQPTHQPPNRPTTKPFYIGQPKLDDTSQSLPEFTWSEPEDAPLKQTQLYETHKAIGAKLVPFGGYDMPVWYSSVTEEHLAVRQTAGLFDVSHMGVFEASGAHVVDFLNTVSANDVSTLSVGRSHYTFLFLPNGDVIDDLIIYRLARDTFLLVVNASNNDKDWAWLNAVNRGEVRIDEKRPYAKIQHPIALRDLRDPQSGNDQRVDLALQGPASQQILLAMTNNAESADAIKKLGWAGLLRTQLAGFDVIVSRTGYTGERVAYELFVHPDQSVPFWTAVLAAGEPFGIKPCGLAARDSTRTEAGLPLYGHEMAGDLNLSPAEAGFGSYAKLWKPFFVGRDAFIERLSKQTQEVVRFRMNEKGVRRPDTGDPVVDSRGKIVGTVTSCAIDSEGYLLGLAAVPFGMTEPGMPLWIYQMGGGKRPLRLPKEIKPGQRLPTPDGATILTRFP